MDSLFADHGNVSHEMPVAEFGGCVEVSSDEANSAADQCKAGTVTQADALEVASSGDETIGGPSTGVARERRGVSICHSTHGGTAPSLQPCSTGGNWLALMAACRRPTTSSEAKRKAPAKRKGAPAKRARLSDSSRSVIGAVPVEKSAVFSYSTHNQASVQKPAAAPGIHDLPASGLPKELGNPRASASSRPRMRARRSAPVPGFAFLAEHDAQVDTAVASCPAGPVQVEAFVTVAGRPGKQGSLTSRISVEEVERAMPVSFIPDVLPTEFADHLLRVFLAEAKNWHTSKRWLYDKEIESHRVESGFRFDHAGNISNHNFSKRWETAGFGDDLRHVRAVVARAVQQARFALRQVWRTARGESAACSMDKAPSPGELAQESVSLASRGQRLDTSSAEWLVRYAQDYLQRGWRWEPNYCVANYYADEDNFLGAHSDPVASIGPWAIVASLTFGAARQFRMKPVGTIRAPGNGGGRVTSYSVRLPHNSLLICWEGFQEFWRHEVPKDKGLKRNPISGAGRLNFTFRKSVPSVLQRRPNCHCGRKAHFKPVLKETSRHRGRYFWSCSNPRIRKGEYNHCDFFQWDDEVITQQLRTASSGSQRGTIPAVAARGPPSYAAITSAPRQAVVGQGAQSGPTHVQNCMGASTTLQAATELSVPSFAAAVTPVASPRLTTLPELVSMPALVTRGGA